MSFLFGLLFAIVILSINKAIVEPFSIALMNRILLPRMSDLFDYINPNLSDWLEGKTGEDISEDMVDMIANQSGLIKYVESINLKPVGAYLARKALVRLEREYKFTENARQNNG